MIICQIITSLVYGGAEKLLVNFSNVLVEKHEIHIIYLKGEPKLKLSFHPRIKVYHVPLGLSCAKNIRSLVKKINPDVVHTHLGHADLIGMYACRGLPMKLYCTMHNVYFKWNWKDDLIFFIYSILFNTIAKKCKVIAISQSVFHHVEKKLHVSKANIKLIHNAIPNIVVEKSKDKLREELNISENSFCALFVGRLEIQKSVETILFAAKELGNSIPNLCIIIVGEGKLKEKLQNLASKLGVLERVFFVGSTPNPEEYFSASDIFVLPSVFEGLGIVVLEAFRASVPVIATNIEGPKELIRDGINGLLFEPKDYKQLSDQILKIYKSLEFRKHIGDNGYKSYLDKYDINSYSKQLEALYLE